MLLFNVNVCIGTPTLSIIWEYAHAHAHFVRLEKSTYDIFCMK